MAHHVLTPFKGETGPDKTLEPASNERAGQLAAHLQPIKCIPGQCDVPVLSCLGLLWRDVDGFTLWVDVVPFQGHHLGRPDPAEEGECEVRDGARIDTDGAAQEFTGL